MMRVDVDVMGLEQVRRALRQTRGRSRDALLDGVEAVARDIETTAKRSIQRGPKSGDVVEKTNPRRRHKQSAPGQPPATDTGRLVNSVNISRAFAEIRVGTNLEYGKVLEFGTRHVAPRPWLLPAARDASRRAAKTIARIVARRL